MHSTTIRAGEVYGPTYDPTLEAAEHGIQIVHDINADDAGEYDPATKTIRVRVMDQTYYRSTATYQLAHAVEPESTVEEAVAFAIERLVDQTDLAALASVTNEPRLWAKALRIRPCLMRAHVAIRLGLPVAVG